MNKKNLLLVVNQLHFGGAQKVAANLSRDLSGEFNVFLAIFNDIEKVGYEYGGELIKIKAPYSANPDQNSIAKRAIRLCYLVFQLRKLKRRYKIDVAISFLEAPNIINVLSRRNEKVVLSVRSYLSKEIQKVKEISVYEKFVKKLYNKASRIVVPSHALGEDLQQNFGVQQNKISVINNYLDGDRLKKLKEEKLEHPSLEDLFRNQVLINVGRLHEAKGQIYLLPVLKKVKMHLPGTKLVIVGGGPLQESLVSRCRELQLKPCIWEELQELSAEELVKRDVFLFGMQTNPYKYLCRSTVFLFPSLYEGFPNALIEAMEMGLPVVAADCNSGPREILSPETDLKRKATEVEKSSFGILMPVPDAGFEKDGVDKWAGICGELLSNDSERIHFAGQASIRASQFGKKAIISQWIDLIHELN